MRVHGSCAPLLWVSFPEDHQRLDGKADCKQGHLGDQLGGRRRQAQGDQTVKQDAVGGQNPGGQQDILGQVLGDLSAPVKDQIFDGKSLINPKQIRFVHQVFAPTEKEVRQAEKILRAYREQSAAGVGVFTVDGKMIDIAFIPGAERTLKLARACGMYDGEV